MALATVQVSKSQLGLGAPVLVGTDFRTLVALQKVLVDSAALDPHPYLPPLKMYAAPPPALP